MKKYFSFMNLKTLGLFVGYCFLIICFSACTKTNDSSPQITYSNIAGINATESGLFDFYINNSRAGNGLNPGDVVGYFSVLPTTNTVTFNVASTSSYVATSNLDCTAGSFYSAFLGDGGSIVTAEDDRTAPQTGKARIRFVNMSTYLTGPIDFGATGGSKIITGIPPKSPTIYFEVDPAMTSISGYNAGTSTPLFSIPVSMQAGNVYVFYVAGTTNGTLTGKLLKQL
ncbi:DUF4397 domain-containing protein [Mucilaginibacter sp.]